MFREPKLDPQIVTKFLPALVSLMVDDDVRRLNAKLPPDERESAITIIEHSGKYLLILLCLPFDISLFMEDYKTIFSCKLIFLFMLTKSIFHLIYW